RYWRRSTYRYTCRRLVGGERVRTEASWTGRILLCSEICYEDEVQSEDEIWGTRRCEAFQRDEIQYPGPWSTYIGLPEYATRGRAIVELDEKKVGKVEGVGGVNAEEAMRQIQLFLP